MNINSEQIPTNQEYPKQTKIEKLQEKLKSKLIDYAVHLKFSKDEKLSNEQRQKSKEKAQKILLEIQELKEMIGEVDPAKFRPAETEAEREFTEKDRKKFSEG